MTTATSDTIVVQDFAALQKLVTAMVQPVLAAKLEVEEWHPIMLAMEDAHQSYFDNNAGPDGEQWPKLSPVTVALKGHGTILVDEGRLKESLTDAFAPDAIREKTLDEIVFGTSRINASIHQEGEGRIPRRSHTGFNEQLISECADLVADAFISKMMNVKS